MDNVNQLADLIMAIIQDKVDERIEKKISDLESGLDRSDFNIRDYRQEIAEMIEEDVDYDQRIDDALGMKSFTTTMD